MTDHHETRDVFKSAVEGELIRSHRFHLATSREKRDLQLVMSIKIGFDEIANPYGGYCTTVCVQHRLKIFSFQQSGSDLAVYGTSKR